MPTKKSLAEIASHRQCRLGERINLPDGTPVNATIHLVDELGNILDSIPEALKVLEKKIEHFLKVDDLVKQKNIPVEKVSRVKIEVDIDHDKAKQKNNQLVIDVIPTVLKSDLLKPSEALNKLAVKKRKSYKKGDKGDEVKLIQEALLKLGFDLGTAGADGDFGNGTKSKIELFQNSYEPKNDVHPDYKIGSADGIVGKNSIKALDEALVDGWKYEEFNWADSTFGKLLGSVESKNDYSAYNKTKGGLKSFYNTNLTTMKVSEVLDKQAERDIFAAGRFQLIPSTLNAAVDYLSIDKSLLFDKNVQDDIFNNYIIVKKRPAFIAYLEGSGSIDNAMYSWAKEFASAGVKKGNKLSGGRIAQGGESYYQGDGYNKAHISPEQMETSLVKSKQERKDKK